MVDQANVNIQQLFNKDILVEPERVSDGSGEWMSVQDASNATGLSMGTLRRYIKARKLKSRRLGRSMNSKLQVWVTQGMLPDSGAVEVFDFEGDDSSSDDDSGFDSADDQPDQSTDSTVAWLQRKLDEKDAEMRSKDSKIEQLNQQLAGATYRNGYLEAEKSIFQEKLLLLEDKSRSNEIAIERSESTEAPAPESPDSVQTVEAPPPSAEELHLNLEALKKELEAIKKPWWKKLFEAPPAESTDAKRP